MPRNIPKDHKVIAIDIDGIITNEIDGHNYYDRTPNRKNIEIVNELYDYGHTIILYTSRDIVDARVTRDWMTLFNVKYDNICFNKPKFDYLWDDRAYNSYKDLEKKLR